MRVGGGAVFCYLAGMRPGENIYLIGARASGKTSVARVLARRMRLAHVDTDEITARRIGSNIAEFVEKHGWRAFRRQEAMALAEAAAQGGRVVATGGGIVLEAANRALLKTGGPVLYLQADPDTLAGRLAADPNEAQRPSLTGRDVAGEMAQVLAEREALYRECADHVVPSRDGPEAVAEQIISLLEQEGGS